MLTSRLLQSCLLLALSAFVPAKTQVEFWTMQLSPFLDGYVNGLIQDYERQHPDVQIKWVDVPWSEMERKVLTSAAAHAAPDVVNMNPQFAAKLAEFGALANPEDYFSPADVAAYVPSVWRSSRYRGQTFAVPWYLTTNLTLYNRSLLRQAGVAVPTDHAGLLDAARVIKQRTGAFAYFPALDGSSPLENLVAMGGRLTDAARCRAGFTGADGERIFQFYGQLYRQGLTPRNVVTEGHRKAVEMFLSGEVAIISTGMQFMNTIKNANPAVYAQLDVAPQLNAAGVPPNIAVMNLAVPLASPRKAEAFRFIRFVTNASNQLAFARTVPVLPSTLASYKDPFFAAHPGGDVLDKARALSVQQVLAGDVVVPPLKNYSKLKTNYARNLQGYMLGVLPLRAALDDIDQAWRGLLGCKP